MIRIKTIRFYNLHSNLLLLGFLLGGGGGQCICLNSRDLYIGAISMLICEVFCNVVSYILFTTTVKHLTFSFSGDDVRKLFPTTFFFLEMFTKISHYNRKLVKKTYSVGV